MIVVPITQDKLTTKTGEVLVVSEYTNFKSEPAVYVDAPQGQNSLCYFKDIDLINDTKVEYNISTKIFESLGVIKRTIHLPQIGDVITVIKPGAPDDAEESKVKVKLLKLHNEVIGRSKGLAVIDTDDNVYELPDVLEIDRAIGSDIFDRNKFLKIYKDYLPYGRKV